MSETFDFVVVGGGSAGAVIAARLSEDPSCRVALIEAGAQPPPLELMPVAAASMQGDAATDWRYRADAGKHAGRGLFNRTVFLAQGKMLGGTSGINYMVYVRGHPGDFDRWAEGGAAGWSYADVLPFFKKSEGTRAEFGDPDRRLGAQRRGTSRCVCPLAFADRRAGIRDGRHGDRD